MRHSAIGISACCWLIAASVSATVSLAAEPRVAKDIAYVEPKQERQTLDVYAPAEGQGHPVIVWLHGGGWRAGNKSHVQTKPQAFVEQGYVFVSINYRLVPNATIKEMTTDVAHAIRWVRDHAKEYGGDPGLITVAGHSAGAHLAALVCTDEQYLKAAGLDLSAVRGCIPVDTAVYDVPRQVGSVLSMRARLYAQAFGDEDSQKAYSPITHVKKGKSIPSFLILHCADRADATDQSNRFAKALTEAGVAAKAYSAEGKNHGTINSQLGDAGDKPTEAVYAFLKGLQPSR